METTHLSNWHRILFGEAPADFLIEVFVRTIIIFLILQTVVRGLGKRMAGQLTVSEMAVMITLGAIIAAPIQLPDRGIITGIVILGCAWAFQRGVNYLGVKSQVMEHVLQGKESLLVKDGVLQIDQLKNTRVSHQQVFAALRNQGIYNLGAVKRLYLEACGLMSIYKQEPPAYGLPLVPPSDAEFALPGAEQKDNVFACTNCGSTLEGDTREVRCNNCEHNHWIKAER